MKNNKILKVLLSILAIYSILGFIVLPLIVKSQLEKILTEKLTQQVSIDSISFNPFLLNFSLNKVKVYNDKNTTISFNTLYVDFFLIKSLDEKHISFKNFWIDDLYVNLVENSDGTFNLQKLLKDDKTNKEQVKDDASSTDIKFQILRTSLSNAKIKYTKYFENKKPLRVDINPINYTLYDLGTYKNALASHSLNLKINNKTALKIDGGLRLIPFEMYGKLNLTKLHPTDFIRYKDENLNFNLNNDSYINLALGYRLNTKEKLTVEINNSTLDLYKLKIMQENKDLISFDRFSIGDLNYIYPQNNLKIDNVNLDKLYSSVIMDKNSNINLTSLIKQNKQEKNTAEETSSLEPLDITINDINLNNSKVEFRDLKSLLNIDLKNININLKDSSVTNDKIKVANLKLRKLDLALKDKKNKLDLDINDLGINVDNISKLANKSLIDKINLSNENMSFFNKEANTKIDAKNIDLDINNLAYIDDKLTIKSSQLLKPNVAITLNKSNKKESKSKPKEVKKTKKSDSSFGFDIGPFKVIDAKMSFQDKNLPIPFKTNVTQLNGDFSQLNSNSSKPTKLKLEGKVDKYGYSKITGIVDINDIKLLTDTNLLFKNIAIKNFTPYSGKFVGREIASGKLNLDLRYNIKNSNLKAKNSIVINDIKFGKKVKSPDAVNLPLDLAIALLEDSDGVINIDLPVQGNVDDPQFSLAPIVWKAFTNLIAKAITSPFRLLGSIFGISADDISSLEFEFGSDKILASEKESLDNIAKILSKKPKLAIKIIPSYHENKDKLALQTIKFDKKINEQIKKIKGENKDKYLIAIEEEYKTLKKSKSLDELKKDFFVENKNKKKVFNKDAYLKHLKSILISTQTVEVEELEKLALQRAQNVVDYLIKEKKISANSILIEKKISIQKENKDKWAVFKLEVTVRK
ncbi:MAG: DUF748 domain-containing protein [Halarcobacter sp.]